MDFANPVFVFFASFIGILSALGLGAGTVLLLLYGRKSLRRRKRQRRHNRMNTQYDGYVAPTATKAAINWQPTAQARDAYQEDPIDLQAHIAERATDKAA